MALDLQEQEELENAKYAWNKWGKWVFLTVLLAVLAYFGHMIWKNHLDQQNTEALLKLEKLAQLDGDNQRKSYLETLQELQNDYPKAIATVAATFDYVTELYENGEYDEAEKNLNWIKGNQKSPLIQVMVIERLATIKLQQKQYDQALNILSEKVEPEFQAQILNLKGDIYLAQENNEEAHKAFTAALALLPEQDTMRQLIEVKMTL